MRIQSLATLEASCQDYELLTASKEGKNCERKWGSRMSMERPHRERGHSSFTVQDCRIWAEIAYLDSATDYREFLPRQTQPGLTESRELVLLDNRNTPLGEGVSRSVLFLMGFFAILIAAYALYLLLNTL